MRDFIPNLSYDNLKILILDQRMSIRRLTLTIPVKWKSDMEASLNANNMPFLQGMAYRNAERIYWLLTSS